MRLVTDLTIDDELRSWPTILSQAMQQWIDFFNPPKSRQQLPKPNIYLVGDKERWSQLGMFKRIPSGQLQDGIQLGDDLFVAEQKSPYYRRLLFLHEATHWIMHHWQGGQGAPWLAEGMADYLGTHRIADGKLQLGIFPDTPKEVPYWGRIALIQDAIAKGSAPNLSEIMTFPDMLTDRMERYSWSWAATTFFQTHPQFVSEFKSLYQGPLDYQFVASNRFYESISATWPGLSIQWRSFVDDLDFGLSPTQTALVLDTDHSKRSIASAPSTIPIDAHRGWQVATPIVQALSKHTARAEGRIIIRSRSTSDEKLERAPSNLPWESEPNGVTIEYYRGYPIGALIGTWASIEGEHPSKPWERFLIGKGRDLPVPERDSILLLRVNDRPSGVRDNAGEYTVTLQ